MWSWFPAQKLCLPLDSPHSIGPCYLQQNGCDLSRKRTPSGNNVAALSATAFTLRILLRSRVRRSKHPLKPRPRLKPARTFITSRELTAWSQTFHLDESAGVTDGDDAVSEDAEA